MVLLIVLVVHSQKIKKELKSLCKLESELDKACFQRDMAYGETKDLVKRTQSDKGLKDKAFKVATDPKYDGYQKD